MPVYVYERPDGSRFELRQGFTDASLTEDPETGVPVRRVLQPAPIIFKGSGWYKTDSRPSASDTGASGDAAKKTDGDGGGDAKADAAPTTEKAVGDATAKVSGEVKAATEKPAAAPAASAAPAPAKTAKSSAPAAS